MCRKLKKFLAKREGNTAAEIRGRSVDGRTYPCPIPAMIIQGDVVTFNFHSKAGTGDVTVKYKFVGEIKDGFGRGWSHFEAIGATPYKDLRPNLPEADVPGENYEALSFPLR